MAKALAIVAIVVVGYGVVTFAQVWQATHADETQPAEAIVVLGAAQYDGTPSPVLASRLDHAAFLYRQGLASIVVVTGGNKPGDRFTEASAGADYLRRSGVPDDALRLEVQGTSSWESLAATARFLGAEDVSDVLLVSDAYHSFRLSDIAREVGLSAYISPSPGTTNAASSRALIRETAAVAVGRIIGYRRIAQFAEPVTS